MCDRPAGAAGSPRATRPLPVPGGVCVPGRIFSQPGWDTARIRIDYGRIRGRYEQDTGEQRTGLARMFSLVPAPSSSSMLPERD